MKHITIVFQCHSPIERYLDHVDALIEIDKFSFGLNLKFEFEF